MSSELAGYIRVDHLVGEEPRFFVTELEISVGRLAAHVTREALESNEVEQVVLGPQYMVHATALTRNGKRYSPYDAGVQMIATALASYEYRTANIDVPKEVSANAMDYVFPAGRLSVHAGMSAHEAGSKESSSTSIVAAGNDQMQVVYNGLLAGSMISDLAAGAEYLFRVAASLAVNDQPFGDPYLVREAKVAPRPFLSGLK